MVSAISDIRIAKSFIGANAALAIETVELDFNLDAADAIEIFGVAGALHLGVASEPVAATRDSYLQSLHIEDQQVTAPPFAPGDPDSFETDDEVIFQQQLSMVTVVDTVNTHAAMMWMLTPNEWQTFAKPVISPVNLTHRVETGILTATATIFIQYRYVRMSNSEIAFAFSRRRR